jgi:hypothetical protein
MNPKESHLNIPLETPDELLIDPAQKGDLLEEKLEDPIATANVMQQKGEFS